ncbi:MAG: EamA family transporter [Bacteroidota bacterium]
MNKVQRAYLELHIAVLLFGLTAILGDLIQLSALVLVWWRVLITSASLFLLIRFGRTLRDIPRSLILQYMGIGTLVALHWICFFGSIKYSNASVCLVCMATTSFFTSLLEPLITRQPVKWFEIALGLLIIPGMVLVVSSLEMGMLIGVVVGLLSALLASLFAIFNKQLVDKADSLSITFLELGSGWLLISFILPFYFAQSPEAGFWPNTSDIGYLLILALLCTTLAYVLALRALKYISAFASNLTINLEPVYGIVLAWLLLRENEELNASFYWGCLIIIGTVLSYPFLKSRFEKHTQNPER